MGNYVGMSVSFFVGVGATLLFVLSYQQNPSQVPFLKGEKTESITLEEAMFQDLSPLLKQAAMRGKTVIVTSVNWVFAQPDSLLDLFLSSFRNGDNINHLLNHLIIVAFDARAFERCKLIHSHCYEIKAENVNFEGAEWFMSPGYNELVWEKVRVQQYILEQDVDIMRFRNPLKHVTVYADLTLSCDYFNGDPDNVDTHLNTGLFYVKSSDKTAKMMKHWHESRQRFPPDMDQNIFNKIKRELVDSFGAKIQFVDTKYFGGFCNYGKDLNQICTMHANCCIGLERKVSDLRRVLDDWKNYTSLESGERKRGLVTWRVPGECIH